MKKNINKKIFQINNKIILAAVAAVVAMLVAYRAVQISIENSRTVFNIARAHETYGTPVETITVKTQTGHLREPVAVRGGRIHVSGARIGRFSVGQQLSGGGRITSVSNRIDLDTGLFVLRTTGAPNGNHFVLMEHSGIFLPLAAVRDSTVMISQNGIAVPRDVMVIASDAETTVVRGLLDGEVVILTDVAPNTRLNKGN